MYYYILFSFIYSLTELQNIPALTKAAVCLILKPEMGEDKWRNISIV